MLKTPIQRILLCDDDRTFQGAIKNILNKTYEIMSAYHGDEALAIVRNRAVDLILLDIEMRTRDEGLRFIPMLKDASPETGIIVLSGRTDFQTIKKALAAGALDFLTKDFEPDEIEVKLQSVFEKLDLIKKTSQQDFEASEAQKKHVLIGKSPALQNLKKTLEKIRRSKANVVITGETGSGKEVVARQLRGMGPDRSLNPFVAVDSSTIQSSTAESLLFGHMKGAFTGADCYKKGIFEEANNGVVYFDEIANMPLEIQARLLRVLQEKEITPLGGTKTIPLEFRVICATNRNLEQMTAQGLFKDDLLQRLNVIPVSIPALRDRTEDIPLLIEHFIGKHSFQQPRPVFSEAANQALQHYPWPGNIRELSNVVAYVLTMTDGSEIDVCDLPPKFQDLHPFEQKGTKGGDPGSFYERVAAFEKDILNKEYAQSNGNISLLATQLRMDRSHLYSKLKQFGIHPTKMKEEGPRK